MGEPLRFISCENEESECERVVNEIIDMRLKRRCKYNDFAILYRGNYQAKLIEIKLQSQNIPYQITGGQSFYAKTEIKDVMAYLRLLINPDDDNALLRIINTPRRQIGLTTLQKLGDYANHRNVSLFTAIDEAGLTASISKERLDRLQEFKQWIQNLSRAVYTGECIGVIEEMLSDINYLGWLHQNASSDHVANKRWENINFLLENKKKHEHMTNHGEGKIRHINISLTIKISMMRRGLPGLLGFRAFGFLSFLGRGLRL